VMVYSNKINTLMRLSERCDVTADVLCLNPIVRLRKKALAVGVLFLVVLRASRVFTRAVNLSSHNN
jgi:hypothetical protein